MGLPWKYRLGLLALLVVTASADGALAACYTQSVQPARIECVEKRGHSADFVSSCTTVPAKVVTTEVECPSAASGGAGREHEDNHANDRSSWD